MSPGTSGFHHVALVTADAPRAVAFYRDTLGLGLIRREPTREPSAAAARLGLDVVSAVPDTWELVFGAGDGTPGKILTLLEWPGARRGGWGVGGVHHVALGAADAAAQLKWKRWLMDRGVAVSGPYDRGYFRSIYFADPDGHILEIATAGPGYTLDEPADALGRELVMPPGAELRGERDEEEIRQRTWPEPVTRIGVDMRLDGIHHVSGITADLERAGDFLEEALGLELVKRSLNQDDGRTRHYFWASRDGLEVRAHSAYTLFGWPGSDYRAREGVGQAHHIAFRAADELEQLARRERLLELGVEVSPVVDRTYFSSFYFRAPDGQLLEVATDGPVRPDDPAAALEPAAWESENPLPAQAG